jgi:hypothetical protein
MTLINRIGNRLNSLYINHSISNKFWKENEIWMDKLKDMNINSHSEEDELYILSNKLRQKNLSFYENKYIQSGIRVLIQAETPEKGIGSFSIFKNWISSLEFMGIKAEIVFNNENIFEKIKKFKPTFFFTSDHISYLSKIDWENLQSFRKENPFLLAFTASAKHDGNPNEDKRIEFAKKQNVDFFITFRVEEYITNYLSNWTDAGFPVLSIPFAANPLYHYYIPNNNKVFDYIFLASSNPEKSGQYIKYLLKIINNNMGFINGPGWKNNLDLLKREWHSHFYSFAKIGLNLHIPVSLDIKCEINERSFILASCGVFQIMDNPLALNDFFSSKSIVVANNSKDYFEKFNYFLNNPKEKYSYQYNSLVDIYESNTIFHRMDKLITFLKKNQ